MRSSKTEQLDERLPAEGKKDLMQGEGPALPVTGQDLSGENHH